VLAAASGLLGLLVGSFLNVVVWRVPRRESVVRPGSHCPTCDTPLKPVDNVPVLSWLILRGRCRYCGARISARYPLVELTTAAVFAAVAWRIGLGWELPALLYLGAISVALALIDIDVRRLPDAIVLPSYAVVLALLLLPAAIDDEWPSYLRALAGMAILYAFYFAIAFAYPAGMGFGDVKLAGVLGACLGWLGWAELLTGAFLGFLIGGVVGIALMLGRRASRRSHIPFGPSMLAGALVAVLFGGAVTQVYLDTLVV
jgi:leader peptidase (prepilin peptidase)/N-methyltransferase